MNQVSIFSRAGVRPVAPDAMANLGGIAHPRISIKGSRFALVDAGGVKYPWPNFSLPVIVVGANPHKSKVYYEGAYDPDTSTPPTCYSDNGVAPSINATKKMARTCAECTLGAWGSDTSKVTGNATKACNDRKKVAVVVVGDSAGLVYELQIPPASLKNWAKYCAFVGSNTTPDGARAADLSDLVTNVSFVPDHVGVLEFKEAAWLDQVGADGQIYPHSAPDNGASIAQKIDAIWDSEMADEIVGLTDKPWQGALAASQEALRITTPVQHALAAPGYGGPAGAQPVAPRPAFILPQPAAPQSHTTAAALRPEPVKEPTPSRRGGPRPGAGRKPQGTQEVIPPKQQEAPATNGEDRDIPPFLRRGAANPAPASEPAQPAHEATGATFGVAEKPTSQIAKHIAAAFSLSTKRT